jgi:hypothetical protein
MWAGLWFARLGEACLICERCKFRELSQTFSLWLLHFDCEAWTGIRDIWGHDWYVNFLVVISVGVDVSSCLDLSEPCHLGLLSSMSYRLR